MNWRGLGDFLEHVGIFVTALVGAYISYKNSKRTKATEEKVKELEENGKDGEDA